ncbi:Uncharacterised protein [Corynebacterium pseudotuberculosis]|nr:hypothetical protein C8E98_0487 [Corynebacterium pseudotuberculosis]VTQ80156.1 Uncharacterised protein [Corynebacterium pseudotuberculosis]
MESYSAHYLELTHLAAEEADPEGCLHLGLRGPAHRDSLALLERQAFGHQGLVLLSGLGSLRRVVATGGGA